MKTKRTAQQVIASLPPSCFGVLAGQGKLIYIKAGERGYYNAEQWERTGESAEETANRLNAESRITRGQREAMEQGSMFGWELPIADPDNWNEDGTPNRERFGWVASACGQSA